MSTAASLTVVFEPDIAPTTTLPVDCDTVADLPYILTATVTANTNMTPWVFVHLRESLGPPPVDRFCKVASLQDMDNLGQAEPAKGQSNFLLTTMSATFATLEAMQDFIEDMKAQLDQLVRDTTCRNETALVPETVVFPIP